MLEHFADIDELELDEVVAMTQPFPSRLPPTYASASAALEER